MKRVRSWKRLDEETEYYTELLVEKGKVVDLVISAYYVDGFGDRQQFVRWDCAHGGFHKDKLYEKRPGKEECAGTLEAGYRGAIHELRQEWAHYKKLFIMNQRRRQK
jgi:hypothetical protein